VSLKVYDILGSEVATLVKEEQQPGYYEVQFNAANFASGIYIYTIEAKSVAGDKSFSSVKKMVLLK
jgi:hypothetical protein